MKKNTKTEHDLMNMKREQPFRVPDHYFDEVTGKILNALEEHDPKSRDMYRAKRKIRSLFLSAAAVVGILAISYLGIRLFITEDPRDDISQNEVLEYLDFYSRDFNESLFLDNQDTKDPVVDIADEQSDAIITYLLDQGIDELILLEEL